MTSSVIMTPQPMSQRLREAIRGRPTLILGLVIVAAIIVLGLAAPWIAPYGRDTFSVTERLRGPSLAHWFGTDEFGRDVFSRVLYGAPYSLAIGFGATAIALVIGVPLGLAAAFFGGMTGNLIMRATDLVMSIPAILLGMLVLALGEPGLGKTIAVVGITAIPAMVRVTRSVALALLQEDFVEAARSQGEGSGYILAREILPNAVPPIMVETGLRITFAILLGSSLSFLGLGPQPPASEWGLMISNGRGFITTAPWISLAPGLSL
ncbi:MAG: ABC transporter permease, partial [Phyllobacterium sp.]